MRIWKPYLSQAIDDRTDTATRLGRLRDREFSRFGARIHEPTASLDLANRLLVQDRIRSLAATGPAILLSTHDPEQAFALGGRAWTLGPEGFAMPDHLDGDVLSRLYGIPLEAETTPSGRRVVGPL